MSAASRLRLVGFAVISALIVSELLLRALSLPADAQFLFLSDALDRRTLFEEDDELFWRLRRPNPSFLVNSQGLRGFLPPIEKQPGEIRIACVGDSCTFGAGVLYEETYGMQLEQLLQARDPGHNYTTILAGLPGYSTLQNRVLFRSVVAERSPDITILYCGGYNDYVAAVGQTDRQRVEARSNLNSLHLL